MDNQAEQSEEVEGDADTIALGEGIDGLENDNEVPEFPNTAEARESNVACEGPSSKRPRMEDSQDILGQQCPICLEAWETTGDHRLCCLKCGHLYGLSCLKRWLASQTSRTCPTCKMKVGKHDIRYLYTAKLLAVDNTELYKMKNDFEELSKSKNSLQIAYAQCLYEVSALKEENKKLKQQLILLEDKCIIDLKHSGPHEQSVNLYKDKAITINVDGGCRVMDNNNNINLVVVSAKSSNPLFAGYGLRSIDVIQYKPKGFVSLHSQPIRDVKFHRQNPWILTVSMDKSFKILDCGSNNVLKTYTCNVPLWSCAWHHQHDTHIFYVGDQTNVSEFDMRQMSQPIQQLKFSTDMSPVISTVSIDKPCPGMNRGVLVCKLNSMWFFEYNSNGTYNINDLPLEGPFVSMTHERDTNQILTALRPTSRYPYTRYILGQLCKRQDILTFDTVHTINGLSTTQKILSRSCFIQHNGTNYFGAYQESVNNITLWNTQTGQRNSSISSREPVLDLCNFKTHYGNYMIALTEKRMEFLKFP